MGLLVPVMMSNFNKIGTALRVPHLATVAVFTVGLAVVILSFHPELVGNLLQRYRDNDHMYIDLSKSPENRSQHQDTSKAEALLEKLRKLTRLASKGSKYSLHLTTKERSAWNAENPCQSRSELPQIYSSRNNIRKLSTNPLWDKVLDEYSNLHRVCMKRVGNLTDYFLNKSNVSIPGCKFFIGEGTNGVGNKLLSTVSAVLYAIVTQRVLLVPAGRDLGFLLCEPFVGSSWMIYDYMFPLPSYEIQGGADNSWVGGNAFMQRVFVRLQLLKEEEESRNCTQTQCVPLPPVVDALVVASGWENWQPNQWFYCKREQELVSAVPWVFLSSGMYTIPKLFGSPAFGSTLKALFPDNMVLTRLLRSTVLPCDFVWTRFKRLNHAYFAHAHRRVAIQLRFYGDPSDTISSMTKDRVVNCVLSNGILPNVTSWMEVNTSATAKTTDGPITVVLITSLDIEVYNRLKELYLRTPTVTGEDVSLVQLTNHMQQSTGPEEDTQALVEVLLLSVSDTLLVTPVSTFGGLAHGYGGLIPWFIRTWGDTSFSPCERGKAVDVCQPGEKLNYECPNDPSPPGWEWIDGQLVAEKNRRPSIGGCHPLDVGGIQVLNT